MAPSHAPLEAYAARLREALREDVTAMFLFGSRATGAHRPDSDYDIAVFVRDDADLARLRRVASNTAYPFVLRGYDFRPVVLHHARRDERSQFLSHIKTVGRAL